MAYQVTGQLSFMLKAGSDTVPTALNLKRMKIQCDSSCQLRKNPKPTTAHILNGCPEAINQNSANKGFQSSTLYRNQFRSCSQRVGSFFELHFNIKFFTEANFCTFENFPIIEPYPLLELHTQALNKMKYWRYFNLPKLPIRQIKDLLNLSAVLYTTKTLHHKFSKMLSMPLQRLTV